MNSRLTVDEKADIMIANGDCSFDHVKGNTFFFQAKSQSNPDKIYIVEVEIKEDNTLDYQCDCEARVLCKHITCGLRLMVTLKLMREYDPRLNKTKDEDDNNNDDVFVGKIKIEKDDD